VADKYVEYDAVLVVIDIVLHRLAAYRHVLFNSGAHVGRVFGYRHVRLLAVYALLDAWLRSTASSSASSSSSSHSMPFMAALLFAVVQLVVFGAATLFAVAAALTVRVPMAEVAATLVLASFGRCFLLLPMVWHYDPALLTLFDVLVLTSTVAALRAYLSVSLLHAAAVVGVGLTARIAVQLAVERFVPLSLFSIT
jgi:lipid intermediate transporter